MEVTIDRRLGNNVEVIEKVKLYKVIEKSISGEWGSDGDQISVIRSTNFTNEGRLNLKEVVKRNIEIKKVSSKKLRPGDIIIEKSGGSPTQPVGRVVYFDLQGTYLCNNFTSILRPKSELIYPKYLHYQLFSSHKFGMTNGFQNKTTGIINLKLERYINELEIPLPSLSTQQKIAEILDTADQLRQYNKQLIEKYDALTQSLFLEMFGDPVKNEKGWEKCKLSDNAKVRIGPFGSLLHVEDYIENGTTLVNPTHIKKGKILIDSKLTISKEKMVELGPYKLKTNDLILGRRGEMGRCAIVTSNEEGFLCGTGSIVIRPKKNLNIHYLYKVISSQSFKQVLENSAKGVTMKNLSSKVVGDLEIPLPPTEIQHRFIENIENIETQKQQALDALAKSEDLFQSLLQRAFKGKLN